MIDRSDGVGKKGNVGSADVSKKPGVDESAAPKKVPPKVVNLEEARRVASGDVIKKLFTSPLGLGTQRFDQKAREHVMAVLIRAAALPKTPRSENS